MMGQKASKPGPPSTERQVLALGLSHTGISSMSAALEILLDEPYLYGGAQLAGIKRVTHAARHPPNFSQMRANPIMLLLYLSESASKVCCLVSIKVLRPAPIHRVTIMPRS